MNKAILILLAYPALLTSVPLVTNSAQATEVVAQHTSITEYTPAKPVFEVVFEQKTPENPMLESGDTVGEASIDKFGCDCSGCRNTVLGLQGKLPIQ